MADFIVTKPGTFSITYGYTPGAGDPANLSSITITSGLRDSSRAYHTLTVTKAVDNLSFTLTSDTESWAAGQAVFDVKLQAGQVKWFFPKTLVTISEGVTQ
jgi:hypothetical protein